MATIRPARFKDCKICWEIGNVAELRTPQGEQAPLWWYEAFVREKQIFLVAEERKRIIGFIFGERTTGDVAFAHHLLVQPEHRQRGIASELLAAFEEKCRKRKLRAIVSYGSSKAGVALMKKHGFDTGRLMRECNKVL